MAYSESHRLSPTKEPSKTKIIDHILISMDISYGIIFGIIAMMSWGASDFFVTKSARGCESYRAFLWSQIIGLVILLTIFVIFYEAPKFSFPIAGLILASAFCTVIANMAFYKSLKKGKVSIVMPVTSCWAVVTVLLSLIFLNQSLTQNHVIGVIFAIAGAVLVSFSWKDLKKLKNHAEGVNYAVIAALAYGIDFVLIDTMANKIGWFFPMLFVALVSACFLSIYAGISGKNISFPKNIWHFIILVGILDTVAYLFYSSSVTAVYGAVMAPIAASSPAVSIFMAKIFLKEKIETHQEIGIALVIIGLILLST